METYSIGKEAECNGRNMSEFLYMKPPLDAHNYRLAKGGGVGDPIPRCRFGVAPLLGLESNWKSRQIGATLSWMVYGNVMSIGLSLFLSRLQFWT
ncbi:hypothetical protein CEXT_410001 [Caerostris extrusa]|uniref:Uncharacterized protein n=1 Tax=Caerostris extrusa TaxID=172846 RepID=A0AAV4XLM1_CAEEX|nr:hypothetical protein CEXT_410001 [Caerostris extrusa]